MPLPKIAVLTSTYAYILLLLIVTIHMHNIKTIYQRGLVVLFDEKRTKNRDQERESTW